VTQEPPHLPGFSDFSPLGRGGFADVFLARQAHLDRYVAVKVFRVTLADRQASEQFRAECQAIGRLDRHPHIVRAFAADVLPDGRPYLVTEHCDGSLQQMIDARGPLPPDRVLELGLPIARALLFAHADRVLHGDVTPQNVLLRATGAPVLADFGLAVLRDYQGNTASGFTMAHAAPETVRYDGAIDERTDVYGLGSTLYTALTGRPPFPARPGEEDAARAHRILHEEPARPSGPAWLVDLTLAMLAKEPAGRPSMTAVADALATPGSATATPAPAAPPPAGMPLWGPPPDSPWAGGPPAAGVGSQEHTRQRSGTAAPAAAAASTAESTRLRAQTDRPTAAGPAARRRWPLIAAAVAVILALGGGAAFVFWPRAEPAPAPPPGVRSDQSRITLAPPVDHGATVDLKWSADATLDYGVLVGTQGQAEVTAKLVGRVDHYTVDVDPGQPYCFRVQGINAAGTVSESNVVPIRNAVCRFANP
jgi:eukaryotic-like serine/threonine-protein kinase